MEEVDRRIVAIERDYEHGATYLTMEAVRALAAAASACPPDDGWAPCRTRVAEALAAAKPAMAGVRNATRRLLRELLEAGPVDGGAHASAFAESLLREIRDATDSAASHAAGLMPDGATVATCSYGSAVLRVLKKAQQRGDRLRATVFEPRAEADAHGRRLANELSREGIESSIEPAITREAVEAIDVALIGADAVTPGFVVNGTPSLELARAVEGRVPFYVVCEPLKLAADIDVELGYDHVPIALVTAVVTEDGLMTKDDIMRRAGGPAWAFNPAH